MRRRGGEHAGRDRWLVSYADFVTLLFAFFVVLFASGQADRRKQAQLAASMQAAFNKKAISDERTMPASPAGAPANAGIDNDGSMPDRMADSGARAAILKQLNEAAGKEIALGLIAITESSDGIVVSLREAGFFDSGAAEILPGALPLLQRIGEALPAADLRVQGNTDDVPIETAQFASNWELSSARACNIARFLLRNPKIRPENLSVAGYAEFHPVASNASAEGRARNRRVDLVILVR